MPLNVIIIGAGIAGLCATISLRQQGHSVQIFEKSSFATETGAAVAIAPNGARVLTSLGFSLEKARARRLHVWQLCQGTTLDEISCQNFEDAEERFGALLWAVHRVDLHNELLRLAVEEDGATTLRLGASVKSVQAEAGIVELEDGSTHQADLVVAADGIHSVTRSMFTGGRVASVDSGMSAFRFLLPTETMRREPGLSEFLDWKVNGSTIFVDPTDTINERHLVWYDCQGGLVQNFVGIHPTRAYGGVDKENEKTAMLQEFAHFHPKLVETMRLADDVKCWPLFIHDPLPTWVYGKVVLVGDAAHPMLPFGGQGSNQAIEDGGALGFLLKDVHDAGEVTQRLQLFEKVRKDRASRVQILSKVRLGKEKAVEKELWQHATALKAVPTSASERITHDYRFDVVGQCAQALAAG